MADQRELSTDPAIKVGAVAPSTTDNAMVVALSPNSGLPASTATIGLVQLNFGTPAAPTLASYGNPVPVQISGGFSNSFTGQDTTTVLAANGVFTGGGGDTAAEYSNISITLFTSHASAIDGLQIQHSLDGTNYDVIDRFTVPASATGAGSNFIVPCRSQNFRVVYTNGATAQTAFRMRTVLLKNGKVSASRPQDARPNDAAITETVSYLAGYNGATWDRLRSSTANGLAVDVTRIVAPLPTGANSIGTIQFATPTLFSLSSAATTNANSVKTTAATVFEVIASNVGAAAAFLKLYNLATAPTVGTSVPFLTVPIPASGVVSLPLGTLGVRFGTGISLSITNLVADADATVIAAAQVKVAISYL